MFPSTAAGQTRHRRRKRELEISLITEIIAKQLPISKRDGDGPRKVLEFGSGDGFQIPFLKKLGRVAALDVCLSEPVKQIEGVEWIEGRIEKTPFPTGSFDLIFSNHTIEHLDDPEAAFREIKRIAKQNALFAFAVPTHIWLALSVPARIYNNVRSGFRFLFQSNRNPDGKPSSEKRPNRNLIHSLGIRGHGIQEDFFKCYNSFKIESWRRLFEAQGFSGIQVHPLLIYGPSEWPIVPTLRVSKWAGWCSSVLFTMTGRE